MQSPELAMELRSARPVASPALRERVRAVAARPSPERRRFAFPFKRVALVAAPAALALAVGGAVVHGLVNSGSRPQVSAGPPAVTKAAPGVLGARSAPANLGAAIQSSSGRLQQYAASLRVQVKDLDALSDATKHAMRVARLLGGYVASVEYSAPRDGRGGASIVVRVPIDRVQDAVDEYSALGTILAQHVSIVDVTKVVEEQAREIARLRADIARLEAGGVTPAERPQLDADKARLDYLIKRKAATVRRAQLARVSLELTTKPKRAAAPAGRFDRTLSDAGGVLLREAEILAYALIVAGPLLLIGAVGILAARSQRRRLERRLLEGS
jgi:Domain of unknown function (DUF4349)